MNIGNLKFQPEDNRYMIVEYLDSAEVIMDIEDYNDFLDDLRKSNKSKKNTIISGNVSVVHIGKHLIRVKYHRYHMLTPKTTISSLDDFTVQFDEEELERVLKDTIMTSDDFYPDINVAYFTRSDEVDLPIRYLPILYKYNDIFLQPSTIKSLLFKYAEEENYSFFRDLATRFESHKDVTDYVSYLRTTIDNCENYDFDKMDLYKSSVSLFYHLIRASQNSSYTSMRRLRDFGLFIRDYGTSKRNSPFTYNMYEKKYLRRNNDNECSLKVLREERKYWEFYNRLESENDRMLEDRELDRWDQEREGFSLELKM